MSLRRSSIAVSPRRRTNGTAAETESQNIRLKVEIEADKGAGFGAFFRTLMAIFSVVGVIATGRWAITGWRHLEERWRSRNDDDRDDGPGRASTARPELPRADRAE